MRNAFLILKKQSWQLSHQDIYFNIYVILNVLLIYLLFAIEDKCPKFWKRKRAVVLEEVTVIMSYIEVSRCLSYTHLHFPSSVFYLSVFST